MTAVPLDRPVPPAVAGPVRATGVLRSEWTKFVSLRSTWWSLATTVLLAVGIGVFAAAKASGANSARDAADTGHVAAVSQVGLLLAVLAVLVLAALTITGEYGTGMVRATMTAVPARVPVLAAKAVVLVAVVVPVGAASAVASLTVGNVFWHGQGRPGAGLADPGVLPVVLGTPLFLAGAAVLGLAVGTLVRSTAGALTVLVALFFVVPTFAGSVPGLTRVASWLPPNAGGALARQTFTADPLPGWVGFGVFAAETAVLAAAAVVRLRRSDV